MKGEDNVSVFFSAVNKRPTKAWYVDSSQQISIDLTN